MKANVPEKIWIDPTNDLPKLSGHIDKGSVEYIRKDVFVEIVNGWLKDCATITYMNGKKRIDEEMYKATVEDFKKYMKGE